MRSNDGPAWPGLGPELRPGARVLLERPAGAVSRATERRTQLATRVLNRRSRSAAREM